MEVCLSKDDLELIDKVMKGLTSDQKERLTHIVIEEGQTCSVQLEDEL